MGKLKKIWKWIDDRGGISETVKSFMLHPVPPNTGWSYVFGSATLFLFILQVTTGIALALLYQPSSAEAYKSLQFIDTQVPLGKILRGIHWFGACGMILMVGIHMMRIYITAAYKYPREMNWMTGVILILLVAVMGFTGQVLRWDDFGVWSAVVAAEQAGRIPLIGKWLARMILGGDTIGGQTLNRYFAYHVLWIPAFIFLFVGFHLKLVLRHGISEPPQPGQKVDPKTYRSWYEKMLKDKGIPFWPYAAWRDVVFSVAVILIVILVAVVAGPKPLEHPPDPANIYTKPQPDWYLQWIYALFALMPPQLENYMIFFGPLVALVLLFCLPLMSNSGERSPLRRPWAIAGLVSIATIIAALTYTGFKAPWSPHFKAEPLPDFVVNSTSPEVIAGSKLFLQKGCLYCHRIDGFGGKTGPDLSKIAIRMSERQMKIRIINGSKDMPALGQSLSSDELNKIIAFLKTRH